ncbi:MAG: radical SAM protein [Bryobacteraceae bacterium]|nr:radical SAM protein [Bryobacteraceae bacterium]
MRLGHVMPAWGMVLQGRRPFLAIEVTRECPLRCPGCYAYSPNHAGGAGSLRNVEDFRGDALVEGVLALVARLRPLHISLVGGEPLVRYRELNALLPALSPVEVQLTTSAVRRVPEEWAKLEHLHIAVSVDGLQQEHNKRRAPATYDRILRNIAGHRVIVHCTVTQQMLERPSYLHEFAAFWSQRDECRKIWFSLFTPQVGQASRERLSPEARRLAIDRLQRLPAEFPKVQCPKVVLDGYRRPPQDPSQCLFARLTTCMSPNLVDVIEPCQLGGTPDCSECGCLASAGLGAIGQYRLAGLVKVSDIVGLSARIGELTRRQPQAQFGERVARP